MAYKSAIGFLSSQDDACWKKACKKVDEMLKLKSKLHTEKSIEEICIECGFKNTKEWKMKLYSDLIEEVELKLERMKMLKERIEPAFCELIGVDMVACGRQMYMITIRPDCTKVEFFEFKTAVEYFLERKCFVNYTWSFEQKGTEPMNLGDGFHVHIVANMKQRSKSEVLRDTLSSWKDWIDKGWIAANCIDVITTKNGESLVQNYLVEYKSDDGHKKPTQAWDELWRTGLGLKRLYKSD